MALRPGDRVLVQFKDDADGLWHERLLASCVVGPEWVVVTPDDEVQVQDLRQVEVRFLGPRRRLPRGIRANEAYLVYFPNQPNNDWLHCRHTGGCQREYFNIRILLVGQRRTLCFWELYGEPKCRWTSCLY